MERIRILHTNDLHSHLENWPQVQRFLLDKQAETQALGQTCYTVDLGDAIDRVHPLTEATLGQANVALMNQVHYDAATIGNNEGLGLPHQALDQLYQHANFPVTIANLRTKAADTIPKWAHQAVLKTTKKGTRVLFWGLTAPYEVTYSLNQWSVLPVKVTLNALLKQYAGQYDVLVLLSHLGLPTDRQIAEDFPQINLIIGSHTHHLLPNGERDETTLLAAAGKYGEHIGLVDLLLDDQHKIFQSKATTVTTNQLPKRSTDQAQIDEWQADGERQLQQRFVVNNPRLLRTDWYQPNPLAKLALAAFCQFAGTTLGVVNNGLFLTDLKSGKLTANDFHKLLPHALHVLRVTLSGYDLWRLIAEMEGAKQFLNHFPMRGMGFRGQRFGYIQYQGLRFDSKTQQLWANNQLVDPQANYQIAVPDNYALIPFFPTISIVGKQELLYDKLLRTVLADDLAHSGRLTNYEGGETT